MRAKLIMLVGILSAGGFLLTGSAPASAHGTHSHPAAETVVIHANGSAGRVARDVCTASQHRAGDANFECEMAAAPEMPFQPTHDGNCCCGGALCHASAALATLPVTFCYRVSEGVELPIAIAMARDVPGGIERPPRATAL